MMTYYEKRVRIGRKIGDLGVLYKVQTWYLFGFVPLFRRWTMLTVGNELALPSET